MPRRLAKIGQRMAWHKTSPASRGYGKEWHKARAKVIKRDGGTCQLCGKPGTDVDHITPKSKGGTDALTNLRLLCRECHKDATTAGNGHRVRPRFGLDGWPVGRG